eukprot:5427373-Pleurochrysis_carterae.AAC.1
MAYASAAARNAMLRTMEMIEALDQRASETNASRAVADFTPTSEARRGVVVGGMLTGAVGRESLACVVSGDVSKKGSDARETGTVWWSASRMSIS